MKNYKIEEKLFLSKAIISNVHSMRLKSRFSENDDNEELVNQSVELAVLMLEKRNLLFGQTEKKISQKIIVPEVDFEEIITIFNQVCHGLPEARLTKERNNAILKILETYTLQDIGDVFKNVSQSDYLMGKVVSWKANFNWIFTPTNFIKILENNYKNNTANGNQPKSNEEIFANAMQSEVGRNFRY